MPLDNKAPEPNSGTIILNGFGPYSVQDEQVLKADCEKRGGTWDHMDGTRAIATNPPITVSHCDGGTPAKGSE